MNVSMSAAFNDSANAVWATISDFGIIGKFVAGIASSTLNGSGVGSVRTLSLTNGVVVVERLESLDAHAKTLTYVIVESPLPISGYLSTMTLSDLGNNRCELQWSAVFEPVGVSEAEAGKIIEGVYNTGFEGLRKLHGS